MKLPQLELDRCGTAALCLCAQCWRAEDEEDDLRPHLPPLLAVVMNGDASPPPPPPSDMVNTAAIATARWDRRYAHKDNDWNVGAGAALVAVEGSGLRSRARRGKWISIRRVRLDGGVDSLVDGGDVMVVSIRRFDGGVDNLVDGGDVVLILLDSEGRAGRRSASRKSRSDGAG